MPEFKVGDHVDFKQDIEGHGEVIEVIKSQGMFRTIYTYVIASAEHGPWHVTSRFSSKHNRYVVTIEDGYKMWLSH